jgi:hypothetical protein
VQEGSNQPKPLGTRATWDEFLEILCDITMARILLESALHGAVLCAPVQWPTGLAHDRFTAGLLEDGLH